jgi:hypothetical protein
MVYSSYFIALLLPEKHQEHCGAFLAVAVVTDYGFARLCLLGRGIVGDKWL